MQINPSEQRSALGKLQSVVSIANELAQDIEHIYHGPYLSSDQRWAMYLKELARMGCEIGQASEWERRVRSLVTLTPGDFAVVSRQAVILGETPTPGTVYEVLHSECEAKEHTRKSIGFIG